MIDNNLGQVPAFIICPIRPLRLAGMNQLNMALYISKRFQTSAACRRFLLMLTLMGALAAGNMLSAQMITGVWKGKSGNQQLEVKIIQDGDSLRGSSYYSMGKNQYRRYSIRGYFDSRTNEAIWWDDQLIEEQPTGGTRKGLLPMMNRADFNCPGDGRMMLEGNSGEREREEPHADLHLDKTTGTRFPDEWDFVIDNYTMGANDPFIIDSIGSIAFHKPTPAPPQIFQQSIKEKKPSTETVFIPGPVQEKKMLPPTIATPEEKYKERKRVKVTDIPLAGDSIELRFYDNAEIDGDSISLFLNGKLWQSHIRLTGQAYVVRFAVADLQIENELTMVAENLGSIPPNTSYMVAENAGQRYEARLESTEGSSASIRLFKPSSGN